MSDELTCPRCGGSGTLTYSAYKGTETDPQEVRAAKAALREAYGIGHRIPDAPSSEQVLVALAAELSDVEFETSSE